ncbi:MAG TPA: BCCT family transporter, partial [Homoserinimonas sp.]|nr:BCCT family transporter [Homoserinimonas sp.]
MAHVPDDQYAARLGDTSSESPARGWASIDKTVFGVAAGIILAICLAGVFFTDAVEEGASTALGWVTQNVGWLFILGATGFVIFALVLAFGRYGNIPLSSEGEKTEFSTISWVAMMFSAGMGIGLMFFG